MKEVILPPVTPSAANTRMFAVRTSVRTPRSARNFIRRTSSRNTSNGRLRSPSPSDREILGRPALRSDSIEGAVAVVTPPSGKRASIFDLFSLPPTVTATNSPADAVVLGSCAHVLRGSRSGTSSSCQTRKGSAIDNPEPSALQLQVSQRGSQNLSTLSGRPQVLGLKTNIGNLTPSSSTDLVAKMDKGKGVVRDVIHSTLSSMRVAPVDLQVFSCIGARTMDIVRSSSSGNCVAAMKGLPPSGSACSVNDTFSKMKGPRLPLGRRPLQESSSVEVSIFIRNRTLPITDFHPAFGRLKKLVCCPLRLRKATNPFVRSGNPPMGRAAELCVPRTTILVEPSDRLRRHHMMACQAGPCGLFRLRQAPLLRRQSIMSLSQLDCLVDLWDLADLWG